MCRAQARRYGSACWAKQAAGISKNVSRKNAKQQRAQRSRTNCALRIFASWREVVDFFAGRQNHREWSLSAFAFWILNFEF
jgi:hypothetical protein